MMLRVPDYYNDFKCTAEQCRDNCCIGWEIDIDERTMEYYSSVQGEMGDRLKANISLDNTPHFVLGENERCPFLNQRNLCDIILTLGEEHICDICTRHPRYVNQFGDLTEMGVGLACEEAARLILSRDGSDTLCACNEPPPSAEDEEFDVELFKALLEARERIFSILANRTSPLAERLMCVLDFAAALQEELMCGVDGYLFEFIREYDPSCEFESEDGTNAIWEFYRTLESVGADWDALSSSPLPECGGLSEIEGEHLAVYFIFRYFLKAVFDSDAYSRAAFAILSVGIISLLCSGKNESVHRADIAHIYSKEIEYSDENVNALLDALCFDEGFAPEKLTGLVYSAFGIEKQFSD
ncbi:MAG: flagellin lysine-N-methylase [Oscillospiraceae bacterium]|nr:flagellin lysine-N-methylase [Oscillospiraceae bacterium]